MPRSRFTDLSLEEEEMELKRAFIERRRWMGRVLRRRKRQAMKPRVSRADIVERAKEIYLANEGAVSWADVMRKAYSEFTDERKHNG